MQASVVNLHYFPGVQRYWIRCKGTQHRWRSLLLRSLPDGELAVFLLDCAIRGGCENYLMTTKDSRQMTVMHR